MSSGTHTSMRSNLAAGYPPLVEQPHQKSPRNLQQIGRLPGGQFGVHRCQCDGIATGHLVQHLRRSRTAWAGISTDSASAMPNRTGTGSVASLNSASFEAVRAAKTTSLSLTRLVALFSPVRSSIGPPPFRHPTYVANDTNATCDTNERELETPSFGRTSQRLGPAPPFRIRLLPPRTRVQATLEVTVMALILRSIATTFVLAGTLILAGTAGAAEGKHAGMVLIPAGEFTMAAKAGRPEKGRPTSSSCRRSSSTGTWSP